MTTNSNPDKTALLAGLLRVTGHDAMTPQDLMATIYRHLGIDPQTTFIEFSGRPVPILHHGRPIAQLI